MAIGVKFLVATLGVVVGGAGIVPVALWQTGYIGNSAAETSTFTKLVDSEQPSQVISTIQSDRFTARDHPDLRTEVSLPFGEMQETVEERQRKIEEAKNCIVVNRDLEQEALKNLEITNKNYIVISCENVGEGVAKKWKGYFPEDVFIKRLADKERFEMKIEIKTTKGDEDSEEKINFLSTILSDGGYVEGSVNDNEVKQINDQQITVVKFDSEESEDNLIFLSFQR